MTCYSRNGEHVSEPTAEQLAVFDPSNQEIHGVFEVMRTYGKDIFELHTHLTRLQNSATLTEFTLPYLVEKIQDWVRKTLSKFYKEESPARIKVIATEKEVWVRIEPFIIDPEIYKGVSATFVVVERSTPQAKSLPYTASHDAHAIAEEKGVYEALLVDTEGHVREGSRSNLFWVKEGKLFTNIEGVLPGVTQAAVCRWEEADGNPVQYGKVTQEELSGMDEVFVTGTSPGAVPIIKIDEKIIGNGTPGLVTKRIMDKFRTLEG
ncbi:MAG: aminotransferase class IV [Candidatus Gracilibacteria bacterium]